MGPVSLREGPREVIYLVLKSTILIGHFRDLWRSQNLLAVWDTLLSLHREVTGQWTGQCLCHRLLFKESWIAERFCDGNWVWNMFHSLHTCNITTRIFDFVLKLFFTQQLCSGTHSYAESVGQHGSWPGWASILRNSNQESLNHGISWYTVFLSLQKYSLGP